MFVYFENSLHAKKFNNSQKVNFFTSGNIAQKLMNRSTRRKIVEVILLNFRSNLGHTDKLKVIYVPPAHKLVFTLQVRVAQCCLLRYRGM